MEDDYEDENVMENMDDEDEEMVNENLNKRGEGDKNNENLSNEGGPPNIQIKPPGTKQKRRSKNDCNGRDYVCGCGKTYLSYPALYTHIKTKHNGRTPDGTNANQVQNGRGRGRPRKNFLINDEAVKRMRERGFEMSLEERHPELREIYNKKEKFLSDFSKEESYLNIYRSLNLLGGPIDPLGGFPDSNLDRSYGLLYKKIKFILDNNLADKIYEHVENNSIFIQSDKNISSYTCDDLFALFLIENSKILNMKFYKAFVILIKLLRDLVNLLGWEILSQFKDLDREPSHLDFTTVRNGEHIPEMMNEFVNIYLQQKLPQFDKHLSIVIVNQFCDWLYKNKFTNMKVSLINTNYEENESEY